MLVDFMTKGKANTFEVPSTSIESFIPFSCSLIDISPHAILSININIKLVPIYLVSYGTFTKFSCMDQLSSEYF